MLQLLLCVAYAVLYGLFGLLLIAAIEWLLGFVNMHMSPEIKQLLRAIVVVLVFITLLVCLFGGAHQIDIFNFGRSLHGP
jgi:hypothetical protein